MRYSSRHYRAVSPAADTPETIADRRDRQRAGVSAIEDRHTVYPELTAENAGAAVAYQDARYLVRLAELRERRHA